MKAGKKIISFTLILAILLSFSFSSYASDADAAATDKGEIYKFFMNVIDSAAEKLIGTIGEFFPTPSE